MEWGGRKMLIKRGAGEMGEDDSGVGWYKKGEGR